MDETERLERLVARQEAVAASMAASAQAIADAQRQEPGERIGAAMSWAQLVVGCLLGGMVTGGLTFIGTSMLTRIQLATITERVESHKNRLDRIDGPDGRLDKLQAAINDVGKARGR